MHSLVYCLVVSYMVAVLAPYPRDCIFFSPDSRLLAVAILLYTAHTTRPYSLCGLYLHIYCIQHVYGTHIYIYICLGLLCGIS